MDRGHARHFGDVACVMGELVAELDPDAVPLCEAPELWVTLDRVERLAVAAKTMLARRVEQSGEWKRKGYRSAAEQMAADAGTSVPAAKSLLETSKRVAKQPKTERALRAGESPDPRPSWWPARRRSHPTRPTSCWRWRRRRPSRSCGRVACG